jgi:hypothetical protein
MLENLVLQAAEFLQIPSGPRSLVISPVLPHPPRAKRKLVFAQARKGLICELS